MFSDLLKLGERWLALSKKKLDYAEREQLSWETESNKIAKTFEKNNSERIKALELRIHTLETDEPPIANDSAIDFAEKLEEGVKGVSKPLDLLDLCRAKIASAEKAGVEGSLKEPELSEELKKLNSKYRTQLKAELLVGFKAGYIQSYDPANRRAIPSLEETFRIFELEKEKKEKKGSVPDLSAAVEPAVVEPAVVEPAGVAAPVKLEFEDMQVIGLHYLKLTGLPAKEATAKWLQLVQENCTYLNPATGKREIPPVYSVLKKGKDEDQLPALRAAVFAELGLDPNTSVADFCCIRPDSIKPDEAF